MSQAAPPHIFCPRRRRATRTRARALASRPGAACYIRDDIAEDMIERLGFLRATPARALVVGDWGGALTTHLRAAGATAVAADPAPAPGELPLDEERPWQQSALAGPFDLIASLATLDTINDLPGALIHARASLAPDGLLLASMLGAGSLPVLRAAMLAGDGERPAARLHPMVDVRAGAQLLQRAGFADPLADTRDIAVRYGALEALLGDLRAQALTSVLANAALPPGKAGRARATAAFADAGADGRTTERFEILTLTGWRR